MDMALLSVIRRWHYRDHLSIREIAKRTGLSRNTVRKYLRSGTVEPQFKVPERPSKLDPFVDRLTVNALRELWAGHPDELRLIEFEAADSPRCAVLELLGAGIRNFFGDTYGL